AMSSILPGVIEPGEKFNVHISHWHGFNLALFMTAGVISIGVILLLTMKKWTRTTFYQKQQDMMNYVYDGGYDGLIKGSQVLTRIQMTGLLRYYFIYMCSFIVLIIGYSLFSYDVFMVTRENISTIDSYMWILSALLVLSVVAVPFINNRLTAIIVTGATGYIVALMFVIFRAPDLALTQLLVETVTVILLVLVF